MNVPVFTPYQKFVVAMHQLPWVYLGTGIASIIAGPFLGKLSDKLGKYKLFCIGSILGMVMVLVYCNLGPTPLWGFILVNMIMFDVPHQQDTIATSSFRHRLTAHL